MKSIKILFPIFLMTILAACSIFNIGKGSSSPGGLGGVDPSAGGVRILLEADVPASQEISDSEMQAVVRVIEDRINGLGNQKAVVKREGQRQISVVFGGAIDPAQLERWVSLIKQTALIEFVDLSGISPSDAMNLVGKTIQTDNLLISSNAATDIKNQSEKVWHTVLTGAQLKNASTGKDNLGQYNVEIEFTTQGGSQFADYTGSHVGTILAIVLDKEVISAPVINSMIPDGKAVISGSFTQDRAEQLAIQLRSGALPVPLKVVESGFMTPGP